MISRFCLVIAVALSLAGSASATPLGLTLADFPDIISGFIDVTYDAGSDSFVASGFALEFDDDGVGVAETILNGTFDLTASIDGAGALLAGGMLTIGGTVPTLGFNSGTLLTGTLSAFGFPDAGGDPLEFTFTVTGGDAAALFDPDPDENGVILTDAGFTGDFTNDFDNLIGGIAGTGAGLADTAPVPEPHTLGLLAVGLFGLGLAGRTRRAAGR